MSEYTKKETIMFYGKRFLKTFVPLALVIIPSLGFNAETFAIAVIVPVLTTLDKWMREQGWYTL